MILVTHPSKPFQFNAKSLPRRGIILKEYAEEIEALYKAVESSAQSEFAPPATWDSASTLAFVRTIVQSTLRRAIADDADIFRNGGDRWVNAPVHPFCLNILTYFSFPCAYSLQATWIRNIILSAMRDAHPESSKRVPMNLVFAFPTITSLARAVSDSVSSTRDNASPRVPEDLWKYVERRKWGR